MLDNIGRFSKPHGTGNIESGKTVIIKTGSGMSSIPMDLNVRSISANIGNFHDLTAQNANIDNARINYIMSEDGRISRISGDTLLYNSGSITNLNSDEINTKKLSVTDTATIKNLIAEYIESGDIHTDYLTVNKSAHFFELVIDKLRSVQGTQMNTAANCTLDFVEAYASNGDVLDMTDDAFDVNNVEYFRCYWKNQDDNGKVISNEWLPLDQALCETFNVQTGVSHNTGNKYYWRLVNATSNDTGQGTRYINFKTGDVKTEPVEGYIIGFNNDFSFKFTGSSDESDVGYDFMQNETVSDFVISVDNQADELEEDTDNNIIYWSVNRKDYGIRLRPGTIDSDNNYIPLQCVKGTFSFTTEEETRLDVAFVFDDNTFEYYPYNPTEHLDENENPKEYDTEYEIEIQNTASISSIIILTQEIHTWEECHWIDLSNTDKDNDKTGKNSIPEAGDVLAQLGYRGQDEPSRGSAIIIAAYQTPDSGVFPPSYAQYQNINDFSLSSHRGTYMDRTGCYIKGNLVSGSTIDDGVIVDSLDIDVEYYQIISDVNPVTLPEDGSKTLTFRILHVNNGEGEILQDLTSFNLYINDSTNGVTKNGFVFSYDIPYNYQSDSVKVTLKTTDNVLKDEVVLTVIDFSSVTDGLNAPYTDFVYQVSTNPSTAPTRPSNLRKNWSEYTTSEKNGWSKTQPAVSTGYYLYMTQREVTFSASNTAIYGDWTNPIRITGQDGEPGRDGTTTEFIYKHFNNTTIQAQNPTGNNNWNPSKWAANDSADYTGPDGYKWFDNPQGVDNSYLYEYVSTRSSYIENGNTYWNTFTTPVLWSKYGENGMDGDGVEYIFCAYHAATGLNDPDYNTYAGKSFTDDDFVPSGWSDDPISPTKTNSYVFVSQRKSVNGQWVVPTSNIVGTPWSQPAIWSHLTQDGQPGQSGDDGNDGTTDKLVPIYQDWEVRTTSTSDYNNITGSLYTNLRYKVFHVEGDTVSEETDLINNGYDIYANVYPASGTSTLKIYNYQSQLRNAGFHLTSDGGNNNIFYFQLNDMLDDIYATGTSIQKDYHLLSKSANASSELPVRMVVQLLKNGDLVDQRVYNVTFKAGHVFEVTDAALNSAFFGSWKDSNGNPINGISHIYQNMEEISSYVSTVSSNLGNLQIDYSSFKETAQGFQTNVTNRVSNLESSYVSQSQLSQTADSIRSEISTKVGSNSRPNLIGVSMFDSISNTFGSNQNFTGSNYAYWYCRKSSNNTGLTTFTYLIKDDSVKYMGSDTLIMSGEKFTKSSGSPNASILYKVSNDLIKNDLSTQEYCFSVYVKKSSTKEEKRILLQTSSLSSGSVLTDWTNNGSTEETNVSIVSNTTSDSGTDLYQLFQLNDTSWHRLYITFKINSISTSPVLTLRIYSGTSSSSWNDFYISMPKLEKGSKPSIWTPSNIEDESFTSVIEQTANSISMGVQSNIEGKLVNTGIDIESNKITLNADNTVINGNLNVTNANEGLIVYNENNPRIFLNNGSIGTLQEFEKNNAIFYPLNTTLKVNASSNVATVNYMAQSRGSALNIGTWPTNTTIKISDIRAFIFDEDNIRQNIIRSADVRLLINGSTVSTMSYTKYPDSSGILINGFEYNNTTEGSKTLELRIVWNTTINGTLTTSISGTVSAYNDMMQTIGIDGAIFKTGSLKHVVFASDCIDFRNVGNTIRLTETGILRSDRNTTGSGDTIGGMMGDISSTLPYKMVLNGSTVSVTFKDCIIEHNVRNNLSVVLPVRDSGNGGVPYGKVFHIINSSGDKTTTITIDGGSSFINNGSSPTSISLGAQHSISVVYLQSGSYAVLSYR